MNSEADDAFLGDVLVALSETPRYLPGKYLWDEPGSVLFDRICAHPDYYPTQRETALLPQAARETADLVGPGATIVEFGSGASRKIRTLLDALDRPARYVAIDISRDYLEASVAQLARDYSGVEMLAVCADYSQAITLPIEPVGPVLGFFPGTSIGNVAPREAQNLLARARETLGSGHFLVGADTTRDESRLQRAYGECGGLMPAFHLNLLKRLTRDLGADIDADAFRHENRILRDPFRVEAHLVAQRRTTWRISGHNFAFERGDGLRTDVSHKYLPDEFRALAAAAEWSTTRTWIDPDGLFGLYLLAA